jgi:general secretion pathway protein K
LLGELEDLQGRLNLNNLLDEPNQSANAGSADPDPETDSSETDSQSQTNDPNTENVSGGAGSDEERRFTSGQKQLIRLLQTLEGLGVDQTQAIALTEAISDYMDADDQRRLAGAEDEAYRNGVPPYRPANQPIASVSELRAIAGITPEIYAALAPLVTVWPLEGSKLNILTAKPPVLRTINSDDRLEPLSVGDAQRLVELRERGEINEVEDLLTDIAFSDTAMNDIANALGITSDWFLLSASVQIADREQRLYSVLQRNERRVVSRYRSLGEL